MSQALLKSQTHLDGSLLQRYLHDEQLLEGALCLLGATVNTMLQLCLLDVEHLIPSCRREVVVTVVITLGGCQINSRFVLTMIFIEDSYLPHDLSHMLLKFVKCVPSVQFNAQCKQLWRSFLSERYLQWFAMNLFNDS